MQLRSQYRMWSKITDWAARVDATRVYTLLDGSRRSVTLEDGRKMSIDVHRYPCRSRSHRQNLWWAYRARAGGR